MTETKLVNDRHSAHLISNRRKKLFLETLARTGKIGESARIAGFSDSRWVRTCYRNDKEFAKLWDLALDAVADKLEDEAMRRAHDGTMEPVYYKGDVVGYNIRYSDTLIMFMLKGLRPNKYGSHVNVQGGVKVDVGVALLPTTMQNPDQWEKRAADVHQTQKLIQQTDGSFAVDAPAKEPEPVVAVNTVSRG